MIRPFQILIFLLLLSVLAACAAPGAEIVPTLPAATQTREPAPGITPSPSLAPTLPDPSPMAEASEAAPLPQARFDPISPLEPIGLTDLLLIVSNPFLSPSPGQDDGHHGTDFSFYTFGDFKTIEGLPVVSVFPGIVSGVTQNRPPYGNSVIIETGLADISDFLVSQIHDLNLETAPRSNSALNCPDYSQAVQSYSANSESIYLLYAHLKDPPELTAGETIDQGQVIGNVGNTGNSGNPHLHLETRVGPSHATFPVMAHYHNSVSVEETTYYCLWRVSNYFRLFDPLLLFDTHPTKPLSAIIDSPRF